MTRKKITLDIATMSAMTDEGLVKHVRSEIAKALNPTPKVSKLSLIDCEIRLSMALERWNMKDGIKFLEMPRYQTSIDSFRLTAGTNPRHRKLVNTHDAFIRQYENYLSLRKEWQKVRRQISKEVYQTKGRVCVYCKTTDADSLDHIVPLSRGGSNKIENIVPCCRSCNSKKSSRHVSVMVVD